MNSSTIKNWYQLSNEYEIDSPALIIYKDKVIENINIALSMVDVDHFRPHVKTNKSADVVELMMEAGILKFKCATIAEAEMLAIKNAKDVLLAYQPTGPKLNRFVALIKKYPFTKFSCLVDHITAAQNISAMAITSKVEITVYIDLNIGMNRTGISPTGAAVLYEECNRLKGTIPAGLHAYDGHIRTPDFDQRTMECNQAFEAVTRLQQLLITKGFRPILIAGGSPCFPIHAKRKEVECSPGTFIFWDRAYQFACPEQNFKTAGLVLTRIISLPGPTKICIDLGHKSIAAENTLDKRVYFLNAPELEFISQSEEHLVAKVPEGHPYTPGMVLYGLPFHICPTVALYERAFVVEEKKATVEWKISRDRRINI